MGSVIVHLSSLRFRSIAVNFLHPHLTHRQHSCMITSLLNFRRYSLGLIALAISAQADLVIEQKMEGPLQNSTMKMSIKGEKIRTDVGTEATSIVDLSSKTMLNLMHAQKMSMEMKMPEVSAATTEALKPKVTHTGEKAKVDGHECEIILMETGGAKMKMWVAKNYPNYEKFKKEIETLNKFSAQGSVEPVDLGGMPLKIESEIAGQKTTVSLVSVKHGPLDDSLFKAPAGYTTVPTGQ